MSGTHLPYLQTCGIRFEERENKLYVVTRIRDNSIICMTYNLREAIVMFESSIETALTGWFKDRYGKSMTITGKEE